LSQALFLTENISDLPYKFSVFERPIAIFYTKNRFFALLLISKKFETIKKAYSLLFKDLSFCNSMFINQ